MYDRAFIDPPRRTGRALPLAPASRNLWADAHTPSFPEAPVRNVARLTATRAPYIRANGPVPTAPVHVDAARRCALVCSIALAATLLPAWLSAQSADAGTAVQRDRVFHEFATSLQRDVAADGVGSIAAGVVIGDSVIWASGFGLASRDPRVEATDSTIYRTGSISKSLTALILARLVQDGTVDLDDAVVTWLPEFAGLGGGDPIARTITLRQLASHTGGLIREPGLEGAATGPIAGWEDKVLASIPTTTLQSAPGERYSYSNIGYGILGLTLSRAAGQPFMDLMRRLLFEPLGMTSSTFVIRPPLDRLLSAGYAVSRSGEISGEAPAREHDGRGYKVPNGGVYSTVHDLARVIAMMSGRAGDDVLNADSRALVMTRQTPDSGQGYGLGFFIAEDEAGHRVVYHSGSVAGYNAWMGFDPDAGIGVILFRNYAPGATNLGRSGRELLARLVALRD
jgi:CubicO group peptidase (beta-lactamase class C family)